MSARAKADKPFSCLLFLKKMTATTTKAKKHNTPMMGPTISPTIEAPELSDDKWVEKKKKEKKKERMKETPLANENKTKQNKKAEEDDEPLSR